MYGFDKYAADAAAARNSAAAIERKRAYANSCNEPWTSDLTKNEAIELLIDALRGGKNNIIELMGGDNGRLDHGSKYNLIQAAQKAARRGRFDD